MSILTGVSAFFGLDIGTTGIRLVQLQGNFPKTLVKYAYVPIASKIAMSDSKADQALLGQAIRDLCQQANLTTRDVAVGIPSQKVFTTVIDIDRVPANEVGKTIHFQADSLIPTPVADTKIDWALIGDSPKDKNKSEVLLTSVTNKFVESRLDMLEAIGLNVISFEPENLAMARALIAPGNASAELVLDVGNLGTDLVITLNDAPRLTRAIPTGSLSIIRAASQNLNIDDKQAEQFVFKFGLDKAKLEGEVYNAIIGVVDVLTNEIEKSIKFFQTRYIGSQIDRIVITGVAVAIPEFPLYIANKTGINVEIGNAWRNVAFASERQSELLAIANQFAVAVGLAERLE